MKTTRMVIGIISIVLFLLISLQSCAAGALNAIEGSGSSSGSAGFFLALCMLVAGIIGIAARASKGGSITAGCFFWTGALMAISNVGKFADLEVWAFVAGVFGLVFFVTGIFQDDKSAYRHAQVKTVCTDCGKEFNGKFCPECGTPAQEVIKRVTPTLDPASEPPYESMVSSKSQKKVNGSASKKSLPLWAIIAIVLFTASVLFVVIGIPVDAALGLTCLVGILAYLVFAVVNIIKKKSSTGLFIGMSVCMVLTVAAMSVGTKPVAANSKIKNASTADVVENAKSESAKSIVFDCELTSGNYISGVDFPAGKYDVLAILGTGNVSTSNMFSGGMNAMMGEKGSEDIYEEKYSNVQLDDGVSIRVSGGVVIKIHSDSASGEELNKRVQPLTEKVSLGSGNYIAGEDFKAGVYDIVAVSGNGNVSSDNMFDGGLNAIMGIDGDIYEGRYNNIEFEQGTTLTVSGVEIQLEPSK